MKKSRIFWIIFAIVIGCIIELAACFFIFSGAIFDFASGNGAEIEIDSYRLCETADGEDVIIIKYLLKNKGNEPTCLMYEGDFYTYQNGISLTEYNRYDEDGEYSIPKEWNYDSDDQYKNIKGGVEYYAEVAYLLEDPVADVEVEVEDYGLFGGKKEKVFTLK